MEPPTITLTRLCQTCVKEDVQNSQAENSISHCDSNSSINTDAAHNLLEIISNNSRDWKNYNDPIALIIKDEHEFLIIERYREYRQIKNNMFCDDIIKKMTPSNIVNTAERTIEKEYDMIREQQFKLNDKFQHEKNKGRAFGTSDARASGKFNFFNKKKS